MIASVNGRVAALAPDGVIVEVAGIGISVQCSPGTLARLRIGEPTRLATSLVVREDSLTLYGFADDEARLLFELLLTASGVGPRLAQAILAVLSPLEVRRAVATEDLPALIRVPGIGKKGAERLVLELRDRIGSGEDGGSSGAATTGGAPWRDQLRQALVGLGWSPREAEEGVAAVAADADDGAELSVLLKTAIQTLSPR
ncbi:MAG: Holliday junction branch migration protein RuvA [Pseudonocardiales bacterium]